MARHSLGKSVQSRKPGKPDPDFPLTPHASGQFCKKIKSRTYYFGQDADEALRQYNAIKDNLLEGVDPRSEKPGETLGWLVSAFLDSRDAKLQAGELKKRTFDEYFETCKRLTDFFGKTRRLASLSALDFGPLKTHYQKTWGPVRTNNEIGRVRVVLNYAFDADIIDRPIKTGLDFKKASKKTLRLHRRGKPKKAFSAGEIHRLIDSASVQLKAMILLGINAGYGNADCGRMEQSWIDFDRAWLSEVRGKTGVERDAWLWPETIAALREAIANRPSPKYEILDRLVFVTKYGNPWHREEQRHTPIASAFTLLTKDLGFHQKSVSFYALRHTFETVAGNCRDQVAVDWVMGHVDESTADHYREGIDRERIRDTCSFVRDWWLAGKPRNQRVAE